MWDGLPRPWGRDSPNRDQPDFRSKPWSSNQVGQVYDLEGLV